MRRAGEQLAREAGYLVEQPREPGFTDDDQLHVGVGDDRRVAGGFSEEREFTEPVGAGNSSGTLTRVSASRDQRGLSAVRIKAWPISTVLSGS